ILPAASLGNSRTLTVIRYGDSASGSKAYIQAGLHADEVPGFLVMHHLIDKLDQADAADKIKGQIFLVPVANPIGVSQWRDETLQGRFDFYSNINFNRQHLNLTKQIAERIIGRLLDTPEENVALIRKTGKEVLSALVPENETQYLKHLLLSLSYDADVVLDLHCDHQALVHVYLGTPLWPDAADLSAQLGADATLLAEDSGGRPFDEACSRIWWQLAKKFPDHPIPPACLSATVELRGTADVSHEYGAQDADNICLFLQRRGFIQGQAPELPSLRNDATPLRGVEHIKAPVPGVAIFLKKPGDFIDNGEVIAEIVNPLEAAMKNRIIPVQSSSEGLLFSVNSDRFVKPGRILAKIAGKIPLKDKGKYLLT
ncbi:MAG: succinylglutamate desuccinylase/aspartoacylase family protein, partial [Deltaproteobacteria bacterium]|nr:succinylglutamate desuccinylase/aspartoacylase family protein [Deltaproteobacteria bacterium]